jgi:putative peptidoglycan lipid II flippase
MSQPAEDGELAVTRRAGIVAAGTFGSRLIGAARDAVIAASFSVASTDAFFVAWTIPNTLRQVLGEGAVSAAFIPVFAKLDEQQGRAAAQRYFARFAGALLLLLVIVSVLGVLTAPIWATLYAGGYRAVDPLKFDLTAVLTAIVFPYILFAGVAALQNGALNAVGHFFMGSFSPAVLNLCMIAAPWTFVPVVAMMGLAPIAGLACATLVGGLLQVVVLLPSLRRVGLPLRPELALNDPAVRMSLRRMAPLILGTGVYQINIVLSRFFASLLPSGSQSFLYYGQRLVEIPQGMLALAVASASLPALARLSQRGEHEQAKVALRHSLRLSLFVAIPASVALAVLALPTVTVIFGRGAFHAEHVVQTARSLAWMAAGVWAVASVQGVTRMFYAYGDTRTPVLCGAANLACFIAFTLLTMRSLGHCAIAAANSVASIVQLGLLLWLLRRRIGPLGFGDLLAGVWRFCTASLVMAAVAADLAALGDWSRGANDPRNLAVYALCITFGVAVYAATSYLLRAPELRQIAAALGHRTQGT